MKLASTLQPLVIVGLAGVCAVAAPAFAGSDPVTVPATRNAEYRLGTGDKLRIEVYKDAQLSQSVQIRPDGKITLPLIGDLDANGRTSIELRNVITTQLKDYVTNPIVSVMVVETRPQVAYVTGGVTRSGAVQFQDEQMTVIQAIALAGGLKDFADSKNIRILRHAKDGQIDTFNYKDATRGRPPVYLNPGDTVIVPD